VHLTATGRLLKRRPTNLSEEGRDDQGGKGLCLELRPDALRELAASLKKQVRRQRRSLKRCQGNFSEKAVHGSRVETRRLASILELLAPFLPRAQSEKAQGLLKEHLNTFDDLRDTQVQLGAVKPLRRDFPAARLFHQQLQKAEERLTRRTRRRVKHIRTRRLIKLLSTCRQEIKNWSADAPAGKSNAMLLRCVGHAFERTLRLQGRIDPKVAETIHRTRVAFKHYRYMVETLAPYCPGVKGSTLRQMHDYQTMMGEIQDAEVLRLSFERFLEKAKLKSSEAGRFQKEILARRKLRITTYFSARDELLDFRPQAGERKQRIPRRAKEPAADRPAAAGTALSPRSESLS
jgi:CHAD domain-containing protein